MLRQSKIDTSSRKNMITATEIKTGYVSGYSTYDGTVESSSDQVTWKTNELYNVIVNE